MKRARSHPRVAPRRAAITAFYAFCREVDDVVDEVSDPGVAATKLAWWRQEVQAAFAGRPSHPVMKALMPLAAVPGITMLFIYRRAAQREEHKFAASTLREEYRAYRERTAMFFPFVY